MFTQTHFPTSIEPLTLDEYLSMGWFRMGQTIFTCHYLFVEGDLFPTVWIRQDLSRFEFRKSHRKLMRKHQRKYTILVREAIMDKEKDELFQRHKHRLTKPVPENMKDYLLDGGESNIYATQEICVYDGSKLVAFSFFDLGRNSLASIMGVFDPEYEKESLGYYTLLREIAWGIENGYEWYYPGYVVPGYDRFSYKLRTGPAQYFDTYSDQWYPYADLTVDKLAVSRLKQRMGVVHQLLRELDMPHELMIFPGKPHLKEDLPLHSPLCIHVRMGEKDWLIDHHTETGVFRLFPRGAGR